MTVSSVLARGRAAAATLMTDTATISRPGASTFNPATGLLEDSSSVVHSGPCNVRLPATTEESRLFGEEQVTATSYLACFPHDVTGVAVDDIIQVTDSDDADLLAVSLRVVAVPRRSHVLYKAFACEVVE